MKLSKMTSLSGPDTWHVTISLRQGLKLALVVGALGFAFVLGVNLASVASLYATRAINITVEVADD